MNVFIISYFTIVKMGFTNQQMNNDEMLNLEGQRVQSLRCTRCNGPLALNNALICDTTGERQGLASSVLMHCCLNVQCSNFIPFADVTTAVRMSNRNVETGERVSIPIILLRSRTFHIYRSDGDNNEVSTDED